MPLLTEFFFLAFDRLNASSNLAKVLAAGDNKQFLWAAERKHYYLLNFRSSVFSCLRCYVVGAQIQCDRQ